MSDPQPQETCEASSAGVLSDEKPSLVSREWIQCSKQENESEPVAETFKIMQWNILADALSHSSSTSNFIKAPQEALKWENRRERLLEEILRSGADIVCLEEVDHFSDFFQPRLSENGFEGFFKPKQSSPCLRVEGNSGPDGCALFYKTEKFSCLDKHEFSLRNPGGEEASQVAILAKLEVKKPSKDGGRSSTNPQVCVAATHLKAKGDCVEIRLAQGSYLYSEMKKFCGKLPGVVCGDFNAQVSEPIYEHFKKSSPWLESSYFTAGNGKEPLLTSWKFRPGKDSKYTIDYVWYTSQLLRVNAVFRIPNEDEIGENGLPGWSYPSDHVALCTDFGFIQN